MYIQGTQKFNPDEFFDIILSIAFSQIFCIFCNTYVARMDSDKDGTIKFDIMCTICHDNKKFAEAK